MSFTKEMFVKTLCTRKNHVCNESSLTVKVLLWGKQNNFPLKIQGWVLNTRYTCFCNYSYLRKPLPSVSYRWSCILDKCTWTFSCQKERSSKNRRLLQWNWQTLEDLADCFLLEGLCQHALDLVCHLLEMRLAPLCPHLLKDIIKHIIKTKKENNLEDITVTHIILCIYSWTSTNGHLSTMITSPHWHWPLKCVPTAKITPK